MVGLAHGKCSSRVWLIMTVFRYILKHFWCELTTLVPKVSTSYTIDIIYYRYKDVYIEENTAFGELWGYVHLHNLTIPQLKCGTCRQWVSITGSKYLPVVNIYIFWKFVRGTHSWVTGRPTDSEILGLVMIQSRDLSILLSGTVYNEAWEIPVLRSCGVEKARGEHAGNG